MLFSGVGIKKLVYNDELLLKDSECGIHCEVDANKYYIKA